VAGTPSWDQEVVSAYVLAPPARAERQLLDDAVARACDAIECLVAEGIEPAMNKFNR
jgi:peptidyl-tRNA hydrolase